MAKLELKLDAKALNELAENIEKAKGQMIGQMAERGYQLLRREVPVATGNLKQGVATPDVDYVNFTAELTVSARSARTASLQATVFGEDGQAKKQVSLRPQKAFNYAEAVAKGRPAIRPKAGKALLIPVSSRPTTGGYLMVGSQIYVTRRSARATKPNPFHERAAAQLEKDARPIAEKILGQFV